MGVRDSSVYDLLVFNLISLDFCTILYLTIFFILARMGTTQIKLKEMARTQFTILGCQVVR